MATDLQVTSEKLSKQEAQLTVKVPVGNIQKKVEAKIRSVARTAKIDGFRKGKVPVSHIRAQYGAGIQQEVINDEIRDTVFEAIVQEDIRAVGMPNIDDVKLEDEFLVYQATVEIFPEIEVQGLNEVDVDRLTSTIDDEAVDTMIESLREQRKEFIEKEGAIAEGDQAVFDFKGTVDDEEFEGGSAEDFELVIGSNQFIPGFEEGEADIEKIKLVSLKSSQYRGREGVEIYPLELMLYEDIKNGVCTKKAITLKNGQFKRSKFKIAPISIFVEKDYLHPLVRGVDITPFHIESKYIVPFAYDESYSKRVAIEESKLREKSPKLLKHFLNYKATFESQNTYSKKIINGENVPFYSMARVGDYTFAPYHVAFRDNTKNVACVAKPILMSWGEYKAPIFQNHAVTISQRPDGSYISLNEAYYIAGIINCDIVCKYVKISSDLRSLPIHPRYQIPLYGIKEIKKFQDKIVVLSKKAHEVYANEKQIVNIKTEISKIYLDMLLKLN